MALLACSSFGEDSHHLSFHVIHVFMPWMTTLNMHILCRPRTRSLWQFQGYNYTLVAVAEATRSLRHLEVTNNALRLIGLLEVLNLVLSQRDVNRACRMLSTAKSVMKWSQIPRRSFRLSSDVVPTMGAVTPVPRERGERSE